MTQMWTRMLVMVLLSVSLTGCWDSTEIDQLAIATASGVDLDTSHGNGPIIHSYLQIAVPSTLGTTSAGSPSSQTGTTDTFVVTTGSGRDPGEALDDARAKISRKLMMSHRRVTVVGESYAQAGIHDFLDEVTRNPSSRLRTILLVAYHETAGTIMRLPYPFERLPQEAVLDLAQQSTTSEFTVKDFIGETEQGDPYTLGVEPTMFLDANKDKGFELRHIAVFQGDKLVGWLNGADVVGFFWLRGMMKAGLAAVTVPGHSGFIDTTLLRARTQRKIQWTGNRPTSVIRVNIKDDLIKNGTDLDLRKSKDVQLAEAAIAKQIEDEMRSTMNKLQHEYHADPVGLTEDMYRGNPRKWHAIERNWREVYSQMPVKLDVRVEVRRSGILSSTF